MINLNSSDEVRKHCIAIIKKECRGFFRARCKEHCMAELAQLCPYSNVGHSLYNPNELFQKIVTHNRKKKLEKLLT